MVVTNHRGRKSSWQHSKYIHDKSSQKPGTEGMYLNIIEVVYETTDSMFKSYKLFLKDQEQDQEPTLITLVHHSTGSKS